MKKTVKPKNISYEPATFGKRFVAYLFDSLFITAVLAITFFLFIFVVTTINYPIIIYLFIILLLIEFFFWLIGYGLIKDSLFNGQSIGKKITKLRVVRYSDQTKACTIWQSIKRNIAIELPYIGVFTRIIGATQIVLQPNKRRLGDGFADTVVIDLKKPINIANKKK